MTKPCSSNFCAVGGFVQNFCRFGIHPVNDFFRGARGRGYAVPRNGRKTGKALLGDGRHIGLSRIAREAGDAQHAHGAALGLRKSHILIDEHHGNDAADDIIQCWCAATIRHMIHLQSGFLLQAIPMAMWPEAPLPDEAKLYLPGLAFTRSINSFRFLTGTSLLTTSTFRSVRHLRDVRKVLARIVGHVAVNAVIDGV